MFEVTIEAGVEPGAGTRTVLDRARAARRTELAAAAELLVAAAEWADLHPVPRDGQGDVQPARWQHWADAIARAQRQAHQSTCQRLGVGAGERDLAAASGAGSAVL